MRLIDAEQIRWTDISENGTHQNFNMVCFKNQIDEMPVIDKNKNYISVEYIEKWAQKNLEADQRCQIWMLLDSYFNDILKKKASVERNSFK